MIKAGYIMLAKIALYLSRYTYPAIDVDFYCRDNPSS